MLLESIKRLLNAQTLFGEDLLDKEIHTAFSSDMMSDVLAHGTNHSLLITSLCNPQVIRTADMIDIDCIIFVRDKQPDELMLKLAREKNIAILKTKNKMFTTCGLLYDAGIR